MLINIGCKSLESFIKFITGTHFYYLSDCEKYVVNSGIELRITMIKNLQHSHHNDAFNTSHNRC